MAINKTPVSAAPVYETSNLKLAAAITSAGIQPQGITTSEAGTLSWRFPGGAHDVVEGYFDGSLKVSPLVFAEALADYHRQARTATRGGSRCGRSHE